MAKPMIGFTYPTVTGENSPKGAAFSRILTEFPKMQMWSDYYSGTALPSWSEPWFAAEHVGIRWYLVSIKHTDVAAIGARIAQMPEHLRGRVMVFLHHEPDQWRSATDPRSDPDPWVWFQRQQDFGALRAQSTWATWIEHWACFTEDRFRTDQDVWMLNWGNAMLANPALFDGVAWDVFNIGRSVVRSGDEMFGDITDFNITGQWPLVVREWGQVTPVDQATDSTVVADAVMDHYDWCVAQPVGVVRGLVWYYNHNNTLADPTTVRRPLTMETLRECLLIATTPEENTPVPDPTDPQYVFGYEAGQQSRQAEVDALSDQVASLRAQAERLNSELATMYGQGRRSALADMVTWAQQQM